MLLEYTTVTRRPRDPPSRRGSPRVYNWDTREERAQAVDRSRVHLYGVIKKKKSLGGARLFERGTRRELASHLRAIARSDCILRKQLAAAVYLNGILYDLTLSLSPSFSFVSCYSTLLGRVHAMQIVPPAYRNRAVTSLCAVTARDPFLSSGNRKSRFRIVQNPPRSAPPLDRRYRSAAPVYSLCGRLTVQFRPHLPSARRGRFFSEFNIYTE